MYKSVQFELDHKNFKFEPACDHQYYKDWYFSSFEHVIDTLVFHQLRLVLAPEPTELADVNVQVLRLVS
jgi:hypothetical protein